MTDPKDPKTEPSGDPSLDDIERRAEELDRQAVMVRTDRRRLGGLVILVAALGALAYAMLVGTGNHQTGNVSGDGGATLACSGTHERLAAARPTATGEVAAVLVPDGARRMPDLAFFSPDGQPVTLSDWRGKTVLINFWATWCAPCRKEMPMLDALQAEFGGDDFEVVAVNMDTQNPEKAPYFLDEIGVTHLPNYNDPENEIVRTLRADNRRFGFPTTILIDGEGCEIGTLLGPAEWDSEDAKTMIRAVLGAGEA